MNPFTVNSSHCRMHAEGGSIIFFIIISFQLFTVLVKQSLHFTYHFLFQLIKWCLLLRFCYKCVLCQLFSCSTKVDSKVAYLTGMDSLADGSVIYSKKEFSNNFSLNKV